MFETKIETDPYLDKLEAKDPALYQELLLEFLKYPLTTASIARHGTTPKSILAKLVQGKSIPWNEVLIHPNCPEDVLNQKLNSTVETDRISISQNPVLTEDQIRILAIGASDTVLVWICRRPDCPSDILESSFSICEQQWNNVVAEVETYSEANNPSVLFDDDDVFGELIESAYYEFDESLAEAIAGNRNTPKEVFKKLLQMNPKNELLTGGSLGSTLMENPSVSKMDKAFLALQGISKKKSSNEQTFSAIEYGGLPSSLAFEIPGFPIKYLEALNEVGHPFALLFPSLRVTSNTYNFNTSVDGWVKHETIYRTLWPELKERDDVVFGYWRSSYDGDSFYFSCKEVDFEHDFSVEMAAFYCGDLSSDEIYQLKREIIGKYPAYYLPTLFLKIDKLPLNSNGKTDLVYLRKYAASKLELNNSISDDKEINERLLSNYEQCFNESILAEQNFFYNGKNSFDAMFFVRNWNKNSDTKIAVHQLFSAENFILFPRHFKK